MAGLITPWNTPFMLESWKLGPALAAVAVPATAGGPGTGTDG